MPKQRCPQCGAQNEASLVQCRLCGAHIDPDAVPTEHIEARVIESHRGSMKGFVFIGLGIVLVLALAGVVFGLVSSNRVIDSAKKTVTGEQTSDGWQAVTDESGAFAASLPGTPTKQTTDDTTTWTAKVASDTVVTITHLPFAKAYPEGAGKPPKAALNAYVDTQVGTIEITTATTVTTPGKNPDAVLTMRREASFHGNPAVYVEYTDQVKDHAPLVAVRSDPTERVYNKALYVLKGDRLYTLNVASLDRTVPQYDRLISEYTFTG